MKSFPQTLSSVVLAAVAAGSFVSCSDNREISEHVQLVLSSETLAPSTTFELRFDAPVVSPASVGPPAEPGPLVIQPPLKGRFVWLSQRSGVFTPTEPTALGTTYRLTLRRDFRGDDGRTFAARLRRTVRTPAFAVEPGAHGFDTSSIPASVELKLNFNADVNPDTARSHLEFRDRKGRRVAADVFHATDEDEFQLANWAPASELMTWRAKFQPAFPATQPLPLVVPSVPDESTNRVLNRLIVSPRTPLPVGDGWRLVIAQGLPSTERALRLPSAREVYLGAVIPFAPTNATAHGGISEGRRMVIQFSKGIDSGIGQTNLLDWFSVSPAPTNLTALRYGRAVELRGAFELDHDYTISVRAGLPCDDGMTLARAWANRVRFQPLPPRLYFPAFSTEQLAAGRREFDVLAVNTPAFRVRAKQLDRHTLIHALRGYRSYFKRHDGDWDFTEPYREVDFNVVAGREIYAEHFTTTRRVDEAQRVHLRWDEILGAGKFGAIFLAAEETQGNEARRARLGTQSIVQLTDLGFAWKSSAEETIVHVFSHRTGRPVAGAAVSLLTDDSVTLANAISDAQGLVTLPVATNAAWLLAESDGDLHAANLREHSVSLWSFPVRMDWRGEFREKHEVFLFTDRPVYRPGETVHFKGIVRDRAGNGFAIPAGTKAVLRVTDSKEEKVLETNLVVSAAGSVAASLALPELGRGHHRLALRFGEREFTHHVLVADFQPNAFAVTLTAKPAYAAGEEILVPLGASYFMGAPLTRAKVSWSVRANDEGFYPKGFEEFIFTTESINDELNRGRGSFDAAGDGVLASKSNYVIAPQIPFNPAAPQPRAVYLNAEVTDLNQQTISSRAEFVAHSSEFYLGLRRFRDVLRAGEPLPVELVAARADGQPHPPPVEVRLNLLRVETISVPMQGAGRARRFRNETYVTNVASAVMMTQPVRRSADKWEVVPVQGVPPRLVPEQAGLHLLEARAADSAGREVVTVTEVYVYGPSENAWSWRNETQMDLVPDKTNYVAGETATVLVKSPFSGHALVTVEREKVLRSFVTELSGNAPSIQVPLADIDAPNVFVSVLLLRGSDDSPKKFKMPEHRLGYCELKIANPRTELHVAVVPDASDYRPSQTVSVTAEVTDGTGQPVRDAEVTLYAVDEGILSLTGYDTPDAHPFFHRPRPLGVRCAVTLPGLFAEDPEQHRFQNKGYLIGGGGRERVRKDFLPCAYWNAALVTDVAGKVSATFSAPDSLTRYRVIAVAHAGENRFGSGASHFEVNKPLMVEPALPRFAHVTDKLLARAVVHNQTAEAGDIEVSLQLDDKAAAPGDATKRTFKKVLAIRAKASAPVDFLVEFVDAGSSKWTWRARFAESADAVRPILNSSSGRSFADAVESTILVEYLAPMLREIHLARTEAAETNLLTAANPQLLEGRGTVAVGICNSRLGELGEALRYLLRYPYGCVEQVSSSLLPWIVLRDAPTLTTEFKKPPEEFDKSIRAGVQRLLSMQTESGGLAYWPGGREPMFWGSAYGGMVLVLARRDGQTVTPAKFDKLLKYLSATMRGAADERDGLDISANCLAAYTLALAGKAEPAYHELLFKQRERLSADNRALLALAIAEGGGPSAMVEELLASRTNAPRSSGDWFHCEPRNLALQLLAWTHHRPSDPKIDVLVTELTHSRSHGHWSTTQGNGWALLALKEYADRVEGNTLATDGKLTWAAQSKPFSLPARPATFAATFPIAREAGTAPLMLANPERHRLYTQVTLEARPTVARQPRQDRGFSIVRAYHRVDDDGRLQAADTLHVGDRVLVTLTVDVHQPAHYLAIDDALPAVLEPLNPAFKSQAASPVAAAAGSLPRMEWHNDHREFRADRAIFFRNHVNEAGRYEIRYLTRVRAAGTATAPCAKVEEMYHPDRFGLSETTTLTALPLE